MKALVRDLLTLESEAPIIRTYGIQLMPELIRTEAYGRLVLSHQIPEVDVDQEWDLMNSRQQHRPGGRRRTLEVIVDESVLKISVPAPVMRGQLDHLMDLSTGDHSSVGIVPMSVGAHPGLKGAFDVLEFPDINDRLSLVHTALGLNLAYCDLTS